jgi:hypothetical protein
MCATLKLATIAAFSTMLAFATGCSGTTTAAAPRTASGYEVVELAPGVELRVAPGASAGAREAASNLQAQYRETYLNAH